MAPPTDPYAAFTEHRTYEELRAVLHFGHIIPISRGLTGRHVAEHYPGWTWNGVVDVCKRAGIVVQRPNGAPLTCDPKVEVMHFDHSGAFVVEWTDGTVTESRRPLRSEVS